MRTEVLSSAEEPSAISCTPLTVSYQYHDNNNEIKATLVVLLGAHLQQSVPVLMLGGHFHVLLCPSSGHPWHFTVFCPSILSVLANKFMFSAHK